MPGLGTRLRARWRALVDSARPHRRRADDSGGATTGSQHADTEAVDLRLRVRMPGPDARSEGPPPEWLAYVMAQDPVWMDGGVGLSGRTFDTPLRDTHADAADAGDPVSDVSTLTSGQEAQPARRRSAQERPVAPTPSGRRPRARFVQPSRPADDVVAVPRSIRPLDTRPLDGSMSRGRRTQHRRTPLHRHVHPVGSSPGTSRRCPPSRSSTTRPPWHRPAMTPAVGLTSPTRRLRGTRPSTRPSGRPSGRSPCRRRRSTRCRHDKPPHRRDPRPPSSFAPTARRWPHLNRGPSRRTRPRGPPHQRRPARTVVRPDLYPTGARPVGIDGFSRTGRRAPARPR